jgi:hypothetical protein
MTDDADFDLADFQKKVLEEFHFLKGSKTFKKFRQEEIEKDFRKNPAGCLFSPILLVGNWIGWRFFTQEEKKRNHKAFEKEAGELLAHGEIRDAICKSLRETGRKEILTEEKFVQAVARTLAENGLRKQFVIPLEPVLFACAAYEISEAGIEDFCRKVTAED